MRITKIESESTEGKHYEIKLGDDGIVYCTCPSWKYQEASPEDRTCKHLRKFADQIKEGAQTKKA